MKLNNSQRAQISLEVIVVLALIALVAVFVLGMVTKGAQKMSEQMAKNENELLKTLDKSIPEPKWPE